ncbi:MAG: S1C family serine protease [Acidobacteriota bacterium]
MTKHLVATLVAVFATMSAQVGAASPPIIHLRDGSRLQGEILKQESDRVVVDLGFTVLIVPADEIDHIARGSVDAPPEGGDESGEALYRVAPAQPELTVKENLARCAEAIVEVRTPTGLGSGFIISPAGHVITNDHVIAGERRLSVTVFRHHAQQLDKVQIHDVRIIATDPHSDLALLKIDADDAAPFATVPLGNSSRIRQGQPVFAVGSPLGLERSVSEGIISLKNRPVDGRLMVQSTTQLNPGNSGGPLLDLRGHVVGVNNLKVAAAGVEGLSFSIPVNVLKFFIENLDAFAFDPRNPNAGFRYLEPPRPQDPPGPSPHGE